MRLPRNPHFKIHKVLRLPRYLHTEVKPLRSLAPVTKSRLNARFPLRLHAAKVTTMSENARVTTTRAQSRQAPVGATNFVSLRSSNALRGFQYTVNNNELAVQHLDFNTSPY